MITASTRGRHLEDHEPQTFMNDDVNDESPSYSRDWLVDDVYYTTCSKPKEDIILLKMDSSDAWFTDASLMVLISSSLLIQELT